MVEVGSAWLCQLVQSGHTHGPHGVVTSGGGVGSGAALAGGHRGQDVGPLAAAEGG